MQNEGKNTICGLCLKSHEFTLESDEATTTEMLEFIGLDLDVNVTEKPLMCKTCAENIRNCFDFKTTCLYNEYCIKSFKNDKIHGKLDLRDIYLRRKENENIPAFLAVSKCHSICRLCMEIAQLDCYILLNDEAEDVISAKTMLERCFPELDLDATNNPVICTTCNVSLHNYYSFIKYCLRLEYEKKCCDIEDNDKLREESNNMIKLAAENVSNYKNGYTGIDVSKNYRKRALGNEIKLEPPEHLMQKKFQLHTKHEVNEHDVDNVEAEKLNSAPKCMGNMLYRKNDCTDMNIAKKCYDNEQNSKIKIKSENSVKAEGHEVYIKCEDIIIKNEDGENARCQGNMQIVKDTSGIAAYNCRTFNYSVELALPHSLDVMNNKNEVECKDEVEHSPWRPIADNHHEQEPEDGSAIWRPFDTDKKEYSNECNIDSDNNSVIEVECDSKSVINRKHLPTVAQEMILNIYEKLESEKGSKYGIIKRISELTKVSHSTVKRIVSRKCAIKRKKSERGQLKKITTSTRDEIKNLISDFYKNGKVPTIDDIFITIREKQLHFPYKSRSTLWRLLSDMGFKFRKINGQHIMESN